ncbi:exodeoxyribonuclease V subunit beta [Actinobacillus delphinicola]|uniref:RecBCD enzyme subunit RecB n=1 Tax=Actinobacillus delphinicola TaxID=51161 RepID=A0A448TW20_9PAST|nr:exodeoxyribonuclease V subunit beta [Actinobacillus delphinicola]VEJ10146.1 exodeoxyribonuclease V subunit beta [Actinobacillus delphinicola]
MTAKTIQPLNPITLPLNKTSLIEASAGTGKTHTIASLYLRLLLQVGENAFAIPLRVDQILVVTFTKMATEELKGRIRERIHEAKLAFEAVRAAGDCEQFKDNPFLYDLIQAVFKTSNLDIAITQLSLAEQDFDLAAIFTIHSFCQRMLRRYAFNSGLPFEIQLLEEGDELNLKTRFADEVWRESFYPQSLEVTKFIAKNGVSPDALLDRLRNLIGKDIAINLSQKDMLTSSTLSDFLQEQAILQADFAKIQTNFKAQWLAHCAALESLFDENSANIARYATKGVSNYLGYFNDMKTWASQSDFALAPDRLSKYFTQSALENNLKKGINPFTHPLLTLAEDYAQAEAEFAQKYAESIKLFAYYFSKEVTHKLRDYKENHTEKSYDDLLWLMEKALRGEQSEQFAQVIRHQYPFAMIDEFQDTDPQQYFIFNEIYLKAHQDSAPSGFLMIGDPKQSIYKFRGADIFSYLKAAQDAENQFTLDQNWRSNAGLIESVNTLFSMKNDTSPFLYNDIRFSAVTAAKSKLNFVLNGGKEPPMRIYLQDIEDITGKSSKIVKLNEEDFAETCALSIRQWLESAKENQATLDGETLQAKDIAVLLRDAKQAKLIKDALAKQGINSVYLSDKSNIFQTDIARDMLFVLQACLNPLNEKNILNVLSCALFSLSMGDIDRIKQQESEWEATVQRFLQYQRIWQHQGVLAMLHQLLQQEQLMTRLFLLQGGERRLTDYLHLAELLQQASVLNESEAALLHWFEKQVCGDNKLSTAEIRLESDRALVKIVTIHKSKGLAYDLVWLPFIGFSSRKNGDNIPTYYDKEKGKVLWDMAGEHDDEILQETLAEEMRLLYVALTRAKYQVVMALPTYFGKNNAQRLAWNGLWNALTPDVLTDKNEPIKTQTLLENWRNLAGGENIVIEEATALPHFETPLTAETAHLQLDVAKFQGKISRDWSVSSFTKMKYQHLFKQYAQKQNAIQYFVADRDYDEEESQFNPMTLLDDDTTTQITTCPDYPEGYSPFQFPAGNRVGTALHHFLEKLDFQIRLDTNQLEHRQMLLNLAQQMGMPLENDEQAELTIIGLGLWINAILETPFMEGNPLAFKDIALNERLNELEFFFSVPERFNPTQFNQILAEHHHLPSEPLILESFKGMMHGFIDLVFVHEGKYYLVDYKSNMLGTSQNAYNQTNIRQKMLNEHYDWQYLIYVVALNRYLRSRLPDYDYERDFGGVIYPFLRGMTGQAGEGIYFDKPTKTLVDTLEALFAC